MDSAVSRDGTRIAFSQSGSGLPLLLVHGTTADHTTTRRLVLQALEARFAVVTMDRRGRGDSGDSARYELAGDAEDIVAVLEAIGEPAFVLAHSMTTPTLLLVGGASLPRELVNARAIASALPNGVVAVLDGQQHIAMHTAPELFVKEVGRFLLEAGDQDSDLVQ